MPKSGSSISSGTSSAAYLKAAGAVADPETLNATPGERIKALFEELKATRLVGVGMRERVVRSLIHAGMLAGRRCRVPRG
jgi:hypothetical protein